MKPYETLMVCGSEIHLKITTANAVKLEEQLESVKRLLKKSAESEEAKNAKSDETKC